MTDNQLVFRIWHTPALLRVWGTMTKAEHRRVMEIADGDDWHLLEVLEQVIEERTEVYV